MAKMITIAPRIHKEVLRGKMPTMGAGDPPFDAAAHFADYDHAAVDELSSKTIICPATYNRKGTVEVCLASTYKNKRQSKIYIHDDGSEDYSTEWLSQFGDRVHRQPKSKGGKQGVKEVRANIVRSILGQYEADTFLPWLQEDFGQEGPEYLYMVDSDGMHDPYFFHRIHEIMHLCPAWGSICLYNAKFHSPRNGKPEPNPLNYTTVIRPVSAGISMFFRMSSFKDNSAKIKVPDGRGWDGFYSQNIANRRVVTSLVSYVEHLGKGGFHNKGSFDRDRALFPTATLAAQRSDAIDRIEATLRE